MGWTDRYGSCHDCRAWLWWSEVYGRYDAKGTQVYDLLVSFRFLRQHTKDACVSTGELAQESVPFSGH